LWEADQSGTDFCRVEQPVCVAAQEKQWMMTIKCRITSLSSVGKTTGD